ncbi:tetratricopeptide repeat protein 28-like [Porites lutea]
MLWVLQVLQGKVVEALLTADHGRAQALNDLLEFKYGLKGSRSELGTLSATTPDILSYLPSNTAFIGINKKGIVLWVNEKGKEIKTRESDINISITTYFQSLLETTRQEIGVKANVNCEDRSLRNQSDKKLAEERFSKPRSYSSCFERKSLQTWYNVVIDPIRDLLDGDEVVIVPQGPLCLAPYAAFMDLKSKYLCETFRIRLLPSLSNLQLIQNCPADWHSKTGVLLVGDPWVQEVTTLEQLEWAEKEVQMIGEILQTEPLVGKQATKDEVLKRISSVALVHIAAHGEMETGEIALAPNTKPSSVDTAREDYLLTMKDVLKAQIRARLVVLSCCHSACGEVKSEGVVGIARAFLGAGARSVLVSLWAIDDEATMEFMEFFYRQLVNGKSASEALNEAMKSMRESDRFSAVKYWAPFVLIGDDVTLEFEGIK